MSWTTRPNDSPLFHESIAEWVQDHERGQRTGEDREMLREQIEALRARIRVLESGEAFVAMIRRIEELETELTEARQTVTYYQARTRKDVEIASGN